MREFHDVMQVSISFTFNETSKAVGIGYDKSGQAIQPPEGAEFELECFTVDIEDHRCDETSKTLYEELVNMINEHIEENYDSLTRE